MSTFDLVYTAIPAGFTLILPIIGGTVTSIDWGDLSTDALTTHIYAASGTYTVSILGTAIEFNSSAIPSSGQAYLTACTSFGTSLLNGEALFFNCVNLTSVPATLPATFISINGMFQNASSFNGDISGWDVSAVTNISGLFQGATSFNSDISGWDVSAVTNFYNMFYGASAFNQNLSSWQVDSATDLTGFLVNSGLSPTNYSALLDGWASYAILTPGFPTSLTLEATPLIYTPAGQAGRNVLTSAPYNWTINDGGPEPTPCFKEGSKILTDNGYRPIETLRKGDLVKTLKHGFVPIDMIGKRVMYNPAVKDRVKGQLYKCSQEQYPELTEDLIITGCHSILVGNTITHKQIEQIKEVLGNIYITDDKYRLPACVDDRTSVYDVKGDFTIYHIALENDDYYMNYGVYANGLLVETCSKRYLKELSKMDLIE